MRGGGLASGVFAFLQNVRPLQTNNSKLPGLVAAHLDAPPMYRQGDLLGAVLAYISLCPAFHIFYRGSTLYFERSHEQLENFIGAGCNAVLSKTLKELVKIERPAEMCEELGLCGDLGMPSTHSQIMAFAFVTMLLQRGRKQQQQIVSPALDALEVCCLAVLVAAVAWSRVYLGYHDLAQITAGVTTGAVAALAWESFVVRFGWVRRPTQWALCTLFPDTAPPRQKKL